MATRPVNRLEFPRAHVQLLAALAAILPMPGLASWMYLIRNDAPSLAEFFAGPLLVGGLMIFWLLFLHLVVCRDSLGALGFRVGGFWLDVATGVALGFGFLGIKYLTQPMLAGLFAPRQASAEILQLLEGVTHDPVLLALWLGPVVWIGIAGFEELWRVVVLRRFWLAFPGRGAQWTSLLVLSVLVGLAHGYQGPAAIVSIGFKSILMGWFFMATGRARPLVVSHAVYDSTQIIMAVIALS